MTTRLGFKRTYAAGAFDHDAVRALFSDLRSTLVAAGFAVNLNSETAIDFQRMGAPAGTLDDDVPHWALVFMEETVPAMPTVAAIRAFAVYGADYLDSAGYTSNAFAISTFLLAQPTPALRLWFACDSVAGWWWLVGVADDAQSPSGYSLCFASAGATSRRYPSENYSGLGARYGIWNADGSWAPAYRRTGEGALDNGQPMGSWSPFGDGSSGNGHRHAGSPLPKMAVPLFPSRNGGSSACVLGEFNELMALTDGYALEEAPLPGWIAFSGNDGVPPFAVPAPASFA